MQAVTNVIFDREERDILATALMGAMPVLREDQPEEMRLLSGVTQRGDAITHRRLTSAVYWYERVAGVLAEESDVVYWRQALDVNPEKDAEVPETRRGEFMAQTLADSRKRMHEDVLRALEVLRVAAALATEPDVDGETGRL